MKFISDLKLKYYNTKINNKIQEKFNTIKENYTNEYIGIRVSQGYTVSTLNDTQITNLKRVAGGNSEKYFKLSNNELTCQRECWCLVLAKLSISTSVDSQLSFKLVSNNAVIDMAELTSKTAGNHQMSAFTIKMFSPGDTLKMTVTSGATGSYTIKNNTQIYIVMLQKNSY